MSFDVFSLNHQVVETYESFARSFTKIRSAELSEKVEALYRLGFGTEEALTRLHEASLRHECALRKQAGVRIGLIVADDATMIFAPTALLIEAGSKTPEKPNAVIIRGDAASKIVTATGGDEGAPPQQREIGAAPVKKEEIAETKQSLKERPVQPFDVARALRVFTSKVQYVDFKAEGYKLDRKVVPLPPELMDVEDETLRKQMKARISSPLKDVGDIEIEIERKGEKQNEKVNGRWFDIERKRIEDQYLYSIPTYGKIIFHEKRQAFKDECDRFREAIECYVGNVKETIADQRDAFIESVVAEYLPRWKARPPHRYKDHGVQPTQEDMRKDLADLAGRLFDDAIDFGEPKVRVIPKNIAPESIRDAHFKEAVETALRRRKVPPSVIHSLFTDFDAAPGSGPSA